MALERSAEGFVRGTDIERTFRDAYLAGAIAEKFPVSDLPKLGTDTAKLDGGFEDLLRLEPRLEPQTVNRIKKCPNCGKPNAYTVASCNACGTDLNEVAESTTSNLFVGMIFGLANAPFPLKISMRLEEKDVMVFDDPLAITRAHMLAVPTDVYVPDIRSLFAHPAAGLKLIRRLDEAAWKALAQEHLSNDEWRRKAMSVKAAAEPIESLRPRVLRAFNLPPSQYQLHLQYVFPPLTPFNCAQWKRGIHFPKGRHFPFDYVVAALEAMEQKQKPMPEALSMTAEELIEGIEQEHPDVNYSDFYERDLVALARNNFHLANFNAEDFKYAVMIDEKGTKTCVRGEMNAEDLNLIEEIDKSVLQTYGRPYGADGKPGGVFYRFARDPMVLPLLGSKANEESTSQEAASAGPAAEQLDSARSGRSVSPSAEAPVSARSRGQPDSARSGRSSSPGRRSQTSGERSARSRSKARSGGSRSPSPSAGSASPAPSPREGAEPARGRSSSPRSAGSRSPSRSAGESPDRGSRGRSGESQSPRGRSSDTDEN